MITVTHAEGNIYEVKVSARAETTHRVTLTPEECRRIGGEGVAPERLIEASFEFLLEREPNTSILRSFELGLIQHYFPDYEREIRRRLER